MEPIQTKFDRLASDPETSPFMKMKQYKSIQEGFHALFSAEKDVEEPFIVSNCQEFSQVTVSSLATLFMEERDVMCWYGTNEKTFNDASVHGATLYKAWLSDDLKYNVVDAPNQHLHLLAPILRKNAENTPQDGQDYAICYALTKANNLTPYHTDKYAQGWVYLTCGTKEWHIFSAKDVEYLENHGYSLESIKNMDFNELVHILDNYLWGKIYVGKMRGGDFIYFPHLWAHRVVTFEKSFGVCGYNSTVNMK